MIAAKDFASPVVQQHKILSQLNPEANVEESTLSNSSEKRMCTGISFGLVNQIDKQKNGGHSAGFHIRLSTRRLRWLLNFTM